MPYSAQYAIAWLVAFLGIVCGVLAGAGLTLHPSWLSGDIQATASVIAVVCVALQPVLPPITRSPGAREAKYLAAAGGVLPDDLQDKHPTIMPPHTP